MSTTYSPTGTSVTDYSSIKFLPGDIINGSYSGAANPIKLPAGNYQLECWGAYGGIGYSGTLASSISTSWSTISSNYGSYFTVSEGTYTFTQGGGYWTANNLGVQSSTASITLTCSNAGTYRITYYYNTEQNFDTVTLIIGGITILSNASGAGSATTTSEYYLSSGSTIVASYSKDSSVNASNESVYFIIQRQSTSVTYTPNNDKNGYWGGIGGYSKGVLSLSSPTVLHLYAGGCGNYSSANTANATNAGGFNGGGSSKIRWYNSAYSSGGGGGGASDIRIGQDSLYARVIVAGGGGATSWGPSTESGDAGGGTSSTAGSNSPGLSTQTSGNSFGVGGNGYSSSSSYNINGAGGGGWYGGTVSLTDMHGGTKYHGGGGSGYVYTSSTASNYPSGCLLNSNYYLTSASTIAGNTTFTSPTGTSETGHSENGYIRITIQSIVSWAYSTVSIAAPDYSKRATSSWTLSPESCKYFSFTPTISGDFIVYSNSSIDTYGYLTSSIASLDSNGRPSSNILASDDDGARKYGGSGSNFGICHKVTAGTTYYIFVKPYSTNTANGSVHLTYYMAHPDAKIFVKINSSTWKQITN